MSFPNSPINGQQSIVGNVTYQYSTANNSWTRLPDSTNVVVNNFTGDGSTTTFTLSLNPVSINNIIVNYNGVFVGRGSYTFSGNVLTFGSAPALGSSIEITMFSKPTGSGVAAGAAGANGQLQFNYNNYFAADAALSYNSGTGTLSSTQFAGTISTAAQPNITSVGTLTGLTVSGNATLAQATVTGNTSAGNLAVTGIATVVGNVSGNYFIGNGSQLTGITAGTNSAKVLGYNLVFGV